MADVLVVGGGIAGLGSALFLARRGISSTLLERDELPVGLPPAAAFDAPRRGVPQSRQSHAFLARAHKVLKEEAPEVLEALWAAGATEIRFVAEDMLPPTLLDRSPQPGDEDLVAIACRRTTFEAALRAAVAAEPLVTLRPGVGVSSLLVDRAAAGPPVVVGVRAEDGEELRAGVVLDATGRRSPLRTWLAEAGVDLAQDEVVESGILYSTRFYRFREGQGRPPSEGSIGGDLGYLKYGVFVGDNGTFSITLGLPTEDKEIRALEHVPGFEAAIGAIPALVPWVEPERSEPTDDVAVMARLTNRRRTLLDAGGAPAVLGLHAIGDALVHTNPLYGRGCSLALVHARLVAEAIAGHPDPAARLAVEQAGVEAELLPWFRASVSQDQQSTAARLDPEAAAADPLADIVRLGVLPASRTDAVVHRAFLRMMNLLASPESLLGDEEVLRRVMAAFEARHERPADPPLGPPRDELLALVAAAR